MKSNRHYQHSTLQAGCVFQLIVADHWTEKVSHSRTRSPGVFHPYLDDSGLNCYLGEGSQASLQPSDASTSICRQVDGQNNRNEDAPKNATREFWLLPLLAFPLYRDAGSLPPSSFTDRIITLPVTQPTV